MDRRSIADGLTEEEDIFYLHKAPESAEESKLTRLGTAQFLEQSGHNSHLLAIGAVVALAMLYIYGTPVSTLLTWFSSLMVLLLVLHRYDTKLKNYLDSPKLRKHLIIRLSLGLVTSVYYALMTYMLPESALPVERLVVLMVWATYMATVLISTPVFPEYYISYIGVGIAIQLGFVTTNFDALGQNTSALMLVFMLFGPLLLIRKSLVMSKIIHKEIRLAVKLEDEIKAHVKSKAHIEYQASHDQLTDIFNRRGFEHQVEQLTNLGQKHDFALIYIDLNDFKPINDNFGHVYGDTVLKIVARRLKANTRNSDIVARIGGDEFCVVLNHANGNYQKLEELSHNLSHKVSEPISIDGQVIEIGVSLGIAYFPDDGLDIDQLMSVADKRMYKEKLNNKQAIPA